ncbi:Polyneuridine-aldehyde esterase [Acorus calamus]|uniref:Polyneuridine-aldehyde esterase n=1 Tax=Acorus calamus TaxID=4465 RepID=A0AAV9CX40_ACOCL|nr:Polyneuridine-aldehyde esterase [Acorus calamus]
MESKKHFVLVHGACHGAWCWYKLATLLRLAGHRVTALDLAASGVHPKRIDELGSFADYNQPLMEFMGSVPPGERVVLVGHSYGGLSLAFAMEAFPEKVSAGVFVTAVMPGRGYPLSDLGREFFARHPPESFLDTIFKHDDGPENHLTSTTFGPEYMSSKMYNLSPPEDFTLATMLVRPTSWFLKDKLDDSMLSERYESVRRVYVVCEEDFAHMVDYQWWMIQKSSPEEVKVIEGADHMVMMSKPKELCECLLNVASKFT